MPRPFNKGKGKDYKPSIAFFKNKFDGFSARIDETVYSMLGKVELGGFMNLYAVPEEQVQATKDRGKNSPEYRLYLKPPSTKAPKEETTPSF